MSTHKHIDRICVVITVLSLLLTVAFMNGKALGLEESTRQMGYESTLFDTSVVHTIDIVIDDWDAFVQNAASEEYSACSVVIDNKAVKNVAIRGKGNTSLSTVATMGSSRYSFKIEFDHYESGKSYKGLDKLCLNNCIQDNTYMKDYLAYRLMAEFGADAPLCSYAWVTVNGEDWGLYLAVEGIEDSFLERLYGGEGDLYKPDSLSMGGGGPGNGMGFDMDAFMDENAENMGIPWNRGSDEDQTGGETTENSESADSAESAESTGRPQMPGGMQPPEGMELPEGMERPEMPGGMERPEMPEGMERPEMPEGMERPEMPGGMGGGPGGFGMGSSDVKLQYTDDDPDSYTNIFDNAKTTVTEADQKRLIRSLKALSGGEDLEEVLDVDELLRYFVVHNYLVNSDSYTGSMIHNYYLREADGQLSMIPWDYNLAFGTFQSGDASSAVNDPIDTPLSVSGDGSRPIVDWIFQNEEYTELYHQYFAEFLETVDVSAMIEETYALIAPYVEKDPTAFCTFEEFETGVDTLRSFCEKRTLSVQGQLDGTIPATDEGQTADSSALIETDGLELSDMGSMGGGGGPGGGGGFGGGGFGGGRPGSQDGQSAGSESPDTKSPDAESPGAESTDASAQTGNSQPSSVGDGNFQPPNMGDGNFQPPSGGDGSFQPPNMGDGNFQPPNGGDGSFQPPDMGDGNFQPPSGGNGNFQPPSGGNGNFQPPSGGDGNFQPPSGGDGNFQPPSGGNGNFQPPSGGDGNFQPPSGGDGNFQPSTGSGGNVQPTTGDSSDSQSTGDGNSNVQPPSGDPGANNGQPQQGMPSGFGPGNMSFPGQTTTKSIPWLPLGLSALALTAGLLVAWLYRRNR